MGPRRLEPEAPDPRWPLPGPGLSQPHPPSCDQSGSLDWAKGGPGRKSDENRAHRHTQDGKEEKYQDRAEGIALSFPMAFWLPGEIGA